MKTLFTLFTCFTFLNVSAQDWKSRLVQFASTGVGTAQTSTIIDYDADGRPDILYGNANQRELFLLRNNASGILQLEVLTDSLYSIPFLFATDFNDDGLDDYIISTSTTTEEATWLCLNQGNEIFEWHFITNGLWDGIQVMYVHDFDGDGDPDIVFDDNENSNVLWKVTNNGGFDFTLDMISFVGQPTRLYGMADLDNDGDQDLMSSYYNFTQASYVLVTIENTGTMNFVLHEQFNIDGGGTGTLGEFTGDDLPDLAFAAGAGNSIINIFENTGNMNFADSGTTINALDYAAVGPAIDHDNDGDDDFYYYYDTDIYLVRQNANNTFTQVQLISSCGSRVLGLADFNLDGELDIALNGIEVWEKVSENNYAHALQTFTPAISKPVAIDIDGNNNPDIITGAPNGQISFFHQTFDELIEYAEDQTLTGSEISFSTPVHEILPYDKNGDGATDLLIHIGSSVYWLINNNNGTYTQQLATDDANGWGLWIGDLDNDGNHDILVYASPLKRREWNGNNYVTTSFPFEAGADFSVMDVDNDGDKDIIYLGYAFPNITFDYLQNNNGSFSIQPLVVLSDYFTEAQLNFENDFPMMPKDLDQDGDEDLVFSSANSEYIAWLRNDGNATFLPSIVYEDLNDPSDFDITDIDADTDLDIVISNRGDGEIMILSNDGTTNFTAIPIDIIVGFPESIQAVDMDNDSDMDILHTSFFDKRIGWLQNQLVNCPRSYTHVADTICVGTEIPFGEIFLSTPGLYGDTLTAFSGCDSVHVLMLSNFVQNSISIVQNINTLTATSGYDNYQWTYNGNILPETFSSLDAADYGAGVYSVTVVDQNSCDIVSPQLNVTTIVSIHDHALSSLHIYPNPVIDNLRIEGKNLALSSIAITDMTGRICYTRQDLSGTYQDIDLSWMSPGKYLLEVKDASGIIHRMPVVHE